MGSTGPTISSRPAPLNLEGKIALVMGSSRGIGAAIAYQLAGNGANVIVNYNSSRESAEKVVQEIKAISREATAHQADVSNVSETIRLFEDAVSLHGGLEFVVKMM